MYTVSITSQGQVTIPAKLRRELKLDKKIKAIVRKEGKSLIVEPIADLMSLKGSLHKYAKKGMSIDKIIEMEEKAWEMGAVERYLKSLTPQQRKIAQKYRKGVKSDK